MNMLDTSTQMVHGSTEPAFQDNPDSSYSPSPCITAGCPPDRPGLVLAQRGHPTIRVRQQQDILGAALTLSPKGNSPRAGI